MKNEEVVKIRALIMCPDCKTIFYVSVKDNEDPVIPEHHCIDKEEIIPIKEIKEQKTLGDKN